MKTIVLQKTKVLVLSLLLGGNLITQNSNWTDYDQYAQARMKEWNIPGMAVVAIKGDSVVFKNTYGFSDIVNKVKVDNQTLFAIGSCTKFFTTTGLAILADENKISFDKPVMQLYPAFKLKDSLLQKQLLLKDILSHRSGLERGEYLWYGGNYSRKEVVQRLVHLRTMAPIRDAFIYNNMMYALAGEIIEMKSGTGYETFMAKHLFEPLQMTKAVFDVSAEKNYALPYSFSNTNYEQLAMPQLKGVEPAGGIWANIDDMSKWLKFHLANGKVDTLQLVSKANMRRLKTPIVFTGSGMRSDETEFKSYGLGMGFTAYKGHRVMYHTGVAGGYTAHFAMLPEENMAVMILTNTNTYTFAMMNNLFDRLLGLEQNDWNSPVLEAVKAQWKDEEQEKLTETNKIKEQKAIANAIKYCGVYKHEFVRPIEVLHKKGKLFLVHNRIEYPLAQEKENEWMAYDANVYGKIKLLFNSNASGNINKINLQLMGEDLEFTRQ